jgi:hypothetical protein
LPPFVASHSPLELIEIVRAVSLQAGADAPTSVSGRVWNAHRAAAGHPDAPLAFSITKRLGVGWPDLLRVAHADPNDAWRLLSHLQADKGRKGVTLAGVFIALRQAAHRLSQPSLNRTDYRQAREQILAASKRTRHGSTAARAMPELTQIEELLRRHNLSWEEGLETAGLVRPERTDQSGLPIEEAVRGFIDDTGKLPLHYRHLRRWARSQSIALQFTRTPGRDGQKAIAVVVRQRERDGLPELERAARDLQFDDDQPARAVGPPARRPRWDRETIIAGMALAVELLGPGKQLAQRSLKPIAAERRDLPIPTYTVVNRHLRKDHPDESWEQWRREAEHLARQRRDR